MTLKRNKEVLTHARLREVACYDPLTGTWKRLKANRGTRVGPMTGYLLPCGHRVMSIDGQTHRASHLAFFYMIGRWPTEEMDHKNCVPDDDRWENLREANSSQNKRNRRVSKRNQSGLKGAFTFGKKWRSQIGGKGQKVQHLGVFNTAEEAHAAYAIAAILRHGEFARAV